MLSTRRAILALNFILAVAAASVPAVPSPVTSPACAAALRTDWAQGVLGGRIGAGGFAAVDFDGDGTKEILAGGGVELEAYNDTWYVLERDSEGRYAQRWFSRPPYDPILHLSARDVTGDGLPDVVVARVNGWLEFYDGRTFERIDQLFGGRDIRTMAVADPDLDGIEEVLASDGYYLFDYRAARPHPLNRPTLAVGGTVLAVGNVDADSALEIVLSGGPGAGYVVDGATHEIEWTNPDGFGTLVALGDVDGDGVSEILAAHPLSASVRVYDAQTRSLEGTLPMDNAPEALSVADADGDGSLEVVCGGVPSGYISGYDGVTGALRWSLFNPSNGLDGLQAADLDGDGSAEILWGGSHGQQSPSHLYISGALQEQPSWTSTDLVGGLSALDVGDVDADGTPEIVVVSRLSDAGESGIIVVRDARTHALEREARLVGVTDWLGVRSTKIASLGDGDADILVATANFYSGLIQVYNGSLERERQTAAYPNTFFAHLAAGDVDGDGSVDIVASRNFLDGSPSTFTVFNGPTLLEEWSGGSLGTTLVTDIHIANVDADPQAEILVAAHGKVLAFDGITHGIDWSADVPAVSLAVGDMDADGTCEILVGETGSVEKYRCGDFALLNGGISGGPPILGLAIDDVDGDGDLDLVESTDMSISVHDVASQDSWTSETLGVQLGRGNQVVVTDLDGDGRAEILAGDRRALYQFSLSGRPVATGFADLKGVVKKPVHFIASGSCDAQGSVVRYAWDFDGNGVADWTGTTPETTHVYQAAGDYSARLTVTDDDGETATAIVPVRVLPSKVVLLSPNGGERFTSGETVTIRWDALFAVTDLRIYYSLDPQRGWRLIPVVLNPLGGYYDWTVPPLTKIYPRARIRVVGFLRGGKKTTDLSDGFFQLSPDTSTTPAASGDL